MIPADGTSIEIDGVTIRWRRFSLVYKGLLIAGALAAPALTCSAIRWTLLHGEFEVVCSILALLAWALGITAGYFVAASLFALLFISGSKRPSGKIRVAAAGLTIERGASSDLLRHEDVAAGWYEPAEGTLVLRLAGGDVVHLGGIASAEQAEALLSGIAAGATERALDLMLRRKATAGRVLTALLAGPVVAGLILLASSLDSVAAVVGIAALLGVTWFLLFDRLGSPRQLLVGHDGLSLGGAGRSVFVPYGAIDAVRASPDGLVLELDDAGQIPVMLLPSRRGPTSWLAIERRDHLLTRIRAELDARRADGGDALGAAQLDRAGRTIAAWCAALRDLVVRPTGGYRAAALDPDHLTQVLWMRDVAPERRLGAALALSATADPALQQRVRVFLDTSAGDALRGALEKAAEDELDEPTLERALASMTRRR